MRGGLEADQVVAPVARRAEDEIEPSQLAARTSQKGRRKVRDVAADDYAGAARSRVSGDLFVLDLATADSLPNDADLAKQFQREGIRKVSDDAATHRDGRFPPRNASWHSTVAIIPSAVSRPCEASSVFGQRL